MDLIAKQSENSIADTDQSDTSITCDLVDLNCVNSIIHMSRRHLTNEGIALRKAYKRAARKLESKSGPSNDVDGGIDSRAEEPSPKREGKSGRKKGQKSNKVGRSNGRCESKTTKKGKKKVKRSDKRQAG